MAPIFKTESKAYIISWKDRVEGWRSIISACKGLPKKVIWRDITEFSDLDSVPQLFDQSPIFIVIPLSLPKFNSVRIAEYAHRLKSRTKVILISGTNCPSYTILRLFDDHIFTPELTTARFEKAIKTKPARELTGKQIRSVIQQILSESSCFRVYQAGTRHEMVLQASLDHYDDPHFVWALFEWYEIIRQLTDLHRNISRIAGSEEIKPELDKLHTAIMKATALNQEDPSRADWLHLSGKWAIDTATKIGVNVSSAFLKSELGL